MKPRRRTTTVLPSDVRKVIVGEEDREEDWSSGLDQEDPGPPHIKEEQPDQEDPGPPHIKEEQQDQEDPGPPHIKEEQPDWTCGLDQEDPGPLHIKEEQPDWSSSLDQEDPGPLHIKEEQPDWSSSLYQEDPGPLHIKEEQQDQEDPEPPHINEEQQEGEQLQGLEEADITPVPVNTENDDEHEAQSSAAACSSTEQLRCSGSRPLPCPQNVQNSAITPLPRIAPVGTKAKVGLERKGGHRCSVDGCTNDHQSLLRTPSSEVLRTQWVDFIYNGNVPAAVPKCLWVCAHHFTSDCFINEGQYNAGFARYLKIKSGSVPAIRDSTTNVASTSSSQTCTTEEIPASRDVACQTDMETRSVGTQLSFRTLAPHHRSAGVQTTLSSRDFDVATSTAAPLQFSSTPLKRPSKRPRMEMEDELQLEDPLEGSSSVAASMGLDSTYNPASSVTTESTIMPNDASTPAHQIKKYIVYESKLLELFAVCPVCTRACQVNTEELGTFLCVRQRCTHCEYFKKWNSQPVLGSTPAGNLHLSAAVYLSGASFYKIEQVCKAMQLSLFNHTTFRRHARALIEPAVIHHWQTFQNGVLQRLSQKDKVVLGGDMRADSPGHSAKLGSYTTMDLDTNTVVDIQLVQSNEVGGSYHMEKEGLKRSLALLDARGVTLDCIVTDRHPQVQKFLREKNVTQYYDVWHLAKGISKELEVISKMKDCSKLLKWKKSINNHVYWTAATSTTGPERVAKWTSILNHVQDIHTHDDPLFPACLHESRQTRDKNKWLSAATPAFYRLEKVVANKRTLKDVAKLSPHHQTSSLEAFHSVTLHFAPKNVVFPFIGMLCRLYLAAMHYNENVDRPQAHSDHGEPLFKVHLPKAVRGECRAKPLKTQPTYQYVADMMDLIFEKVFVDPAPYTDAVQAIHVPEDLAAQLEKPDKEEVIAGSVSRFNQAAV